MTEIRTGESYVAKKVHTGQSKQGPFEIILVQNVGPGQPKIAVSPTKVPSGIGPNAVFKVNRIYSVQHRKWFNKVTNKWELGNVTVRASIKPLAQLKPQELEQVNYKETVPEFPSLEDLFK